MLPHYPYTFITRQVAAMNNAEHTKHLMQCSNFEQLLDAEYGKRGTHNREKFEADAFCILCRDGTKSSSDTSVNFV